MKKPNSVRRSSTPGKTIQRAHAIANGVYVAVVNRVGFEGKPANGDPGLEFWAIPSSPIPSAKPFRSVQR